ncbi:MAG TPA: aldehyde dehydrogenase family protein [Vicinamibacterales bacterium]|jgi:coniferyl-aldehyde dehydrogenase|nr:aldehyde dehydrogenase family protein [Vicinamibacterales bacterium]
MSVDITRLQAILDRQRAAFRRDGAPAIEARRGQLARLRAQLLAGVDRIVQAVSDDFVTRSPRETRFLEIAAVVTAIDTAVAHLADWARPTDVATPTFLGAAHSSAAPRPKGIVGIIVPWNYPVGLALAPLVAAVSAGNRVMLKPSAHTASTAQVLGDIIAAVFSEDEVAVVAGGHGLGEAFASLPFDHLFFTGSTDVGKSVMRAAAANLVPVTLELGGKSPVLIAPGFPVDEAVVPIAWGKTISAGQTCVAPDYALVPHADALVFAARLRGAFERFFPTVADNPDYTAIINDREYARVQRLVADAAARGGEVIQIGEGEDASRRGRKIPPTVILHATPAMAAMQEEIFGPVLPVVGYGSLDEALAIMNALPSPLAMYLFTHDESVKARVLAGTQAGGVTVNGVLSHMLNDGLAFGGVGASGMGAYHGHAGFLAFSHVQSRLDHGTARRPIDRLTAPYTPFFDRLVDGWLR